MRASSEIPAWTSTRNLGELSLLDEQQEEEGPQPRRRCSLGSLLSSPSMGQSIANFVEDEPLLSREPLHLTAELKDRIGEAIRASSTTFITLSLLIYSGQGEKICGCGTHDVYKSYVTVSSSVLGLIFAMSLIRIGLCLRVYFSLHLLFLTFLPSYLHKTQSIFPLHGLVMYWPYQLYSQRLGVQF